MGGHLHRIVIFFFAVKRDEFDGDEGGEETAGEEPPQREPEPVEGIKNLLTAHRRHVVHDIPHGAAFTCEKGIG